MRGHPRLGQNVFPVGQRRTGRLGMEIRPRANHDRINIRRRHDLAPMARHPRDAEFHGHRLRRSHGAVGDHHDLHPGYPLEQRQVLGAGVRPGADDTDSETLVGHGPQ
jgi:hypothetical protein